MQAAAKAGVAFERMCPTDNSCALQQKQQRREEAAAGPGAAAGGIGTTGTLCRE